MTREELDALFARFEPLLPLEERRELFWDRFKMVMAEVESMRGYRPRKLHS
jgi:hypothetical protein